MSFLSSLAKKVSDKAVEVLPDDKKEAVKQLSRGDLSGVKQAAQGLVHKSAAWVQDAAASAKDQRPSANTTYQTQQPPSGSYNQSGSYSQPPFGSYSSCSAAASSGCAPATGAGWAQQQGSYSTGTVYAGPEPSAPPLQHPYTVPNHQQAAGSAASSGSSSSRFTPAPTGAGWKPQHGQGVHGPARQAAAAGGRPAAAAAGNRPAGQAAKLNARAAQARAARMRLGLSVATKLAVVGVGGLVAGCTKKSSTEPGPSAAEQGVPGAAGGDAAAGPKGGFGGPAAADSQYAAEPYDLAAEYGMYEEEGEYGDAAGAGDDYYEGAKYDDFAEEEQDFDYGDEVDAGALFEL